MRIPPFSKPRPAIWSTTYRNCSNYFRAEIPNVSVIRIAFFKATAPKQILWLPNCQDWHDVFGGAIHSESGIYDFREDCAILAASYNVYQRSLVL